MKARTPDTTDQFMFFNDSENRDKILRTVDTGLKVALGLPGVPDLNGRTGIYFRLANIVGQCWLTAVVGTIPEEKMKTYWEFSFEKVNRLGMHTDHHGSSESRDDANQQYAGAIRDNLGAIWSCSGLPQMLDEALMLACAVKCDRLTPEDGAALAILFNNELYAAVMDAWDSREATSN